MAASDGFSTGLRVKFSQTRDIRGIYGLALKVEVVRATGMSGKIFVFHQKPAGSGGNSYAEFSHVASPVDMNEIPEDACSETVPYYRTDSVTVWFRCMDDLVAAKQLLADDIGSLQRTYFVLTNDNNFTNQSILDFGNVEDAGPSDPQPDEVHWGP